MWSAVVLLGGICLLSQAVISWGLEIQILAVTEVPNGRAQVRWKAEGLMDLEFSVLYAVTNGDRKEGNTVEWAAIDNIRCCDVTLNHLRGHSLYTFKVAAEVDNTYLASAPRTIRMLHGVPADPANITVILAADDNCTHVAWTQKYATEIQYYNVSLVLDNGQIRRTQTRRPQCSFPNTHLTNVSFEIRVVAISPGGTSREVVLHHYAQEVGSTSGGRGVRRDNLFWVILAPVIAVVVLTILIAAAFYCRRRRSHSNIRRAKDDNGLSYMPLRLHGSGELRESRPEKHLRGSRPLQAHPPPSQPTSSSTRNNIHPTSLQGPGSEVNRIGRPCETSPHKAHFQLVSESPYLRGGLEQLANPAHRPARPARPPSRPVSLMMSTPSASPRSSKRTPIIPLSEEKLLSRVNTDLDRYPSHRPTSSPS